METETGVAGGRDWGPGDDVTVAVEGGERWREIVAGRKRGRSGVHVYTHVDKINEHTHTPSHTHSQFHYLDKGCIN